MLQIRLLGPLTVSRENGAVPLPASRKVRALLAFLALSREGASRSSLCDLLWDLPNDPRGELRWCLSKVRSVVDDDSSRRVQTAKDLISLDVSECWVDALEADRVLNRDTAATLSVEQLRAACDLFRGELLEGLHIDASAHFSGWLHAQRHRYKAAHLAAIERLCAMLPRGSDEHFLRLQTWLQVAPFDCRAHEALMITLAEAGRVPDAEAHLASAIRQFEVEGIDWVPMRETWKSMRAKQSGLSRPPPATVSDGPIEMQSLAPHDPILNLPANRRASVAVMPFTDGMLHATDRGGIADGLVEDIITRLAKLRVFFVIARGTVFALSDRKIDPNEAGRLLNVEYVVTGSVRKTGDRILVKVDLVDTRSTHVRWAEEFECLASQAVTELDRIGNRIVAAIAEEIEAAERNRAMLKLPSSLDAWEAYHRGLWHMYRFNGADNLRAEQLFRSAVKLDPTFARAHAGLSFTHFQNAFLHRVGERAEQIDLAYDAAGQSLMADDRDPAAHWAMGRALWLRGQQEGSLRELSQCVDLSPNFALGHYAVGFVHSQSGDPQTAIDAVSCSRSLSPFDPLQFAMLASYALAHVRLGHYEESAAWALKAAARPNAHTHVLAIATHCLAVANRLDEARAFAALIRKDFPRYRVDDFLSAFYFDKDTTDLFRSGAQRIGFA